MSHAALMVLWAGAMVLFELSRFVGDKPLFGQGFILVPHLSMLAPLPPPPALAFHAFTAAVLHLFSGGPLALGGCFHAPLSSERLGSAAAGSPFSFSCRDRFRTSSILAAHLLPLGVSRSALKRVGGEGFIVSVGSVEDVAGGHFWLAAFLVVGSAWHLQTSPPSAVSRSFVWAGEGFLSYSLSALSLAGFAAAAFAWYNTTAYPSEFLGPTAPEASQAQSFTFLARDQRLGAAVGASQGPASLGKYLMRSPAGEVIFGGETMRFWTMQAAWAEPLRASYGLEPLKLRRDLEPWQERRAGELMIHAPLGSLNSAGGVATEVNAANFASPRSWLTCSHWFLSFFLLVGHWWHGGRSRASILKAERGLSRRHEQALFVRAID